MSGPTSTGAISLPIDFLDVGLLKNRSYKPLGMIMIPDSSKETPESLVQKVQTSAYRQLKELRDIKPDDIRIFVKGHWSVRGKTGYIDRLHFPNGIEIQNLINRSRVLNVALQVEVWRKGDTSSPSEYYRQSQQGSGYLDTSRDAIAKILQVEAVKVDEAIHQNERRVVPDKEAPIKKIAVRLLTSHCVRAFRKDLDRRILDANGIVDVKAHKVDVFFKKYQTVVVPGMKSVKESKDVFEEHVFRAIETAKPLKIQYRIKRVSPLEKTSKKEVETPVEVKEKRTTPLSFGQSAAFGRQPASTSPPAVVLPSIGSAFDAFIRSEPLRMVNDASGPSLFKTLHEGFYEAVKQASEVQANINAAEFTSTARGDQEKVEVSAAPAFEKQDLKPKAGFKEEIAADNVEGKGKAKQEDFNDKKDGLRQVEALLTRFMVNLNQTLIDNFGDDASTLTILHDDEPATVPKKAAVPSSPCIGSSQRCSEPKQYKADEGDMTPRSSRVRHNASCNLCNHSIIGTRFKCTLCPDWDCCSNCKGSADLLHPGHGLMTIDSLSVLPDRVRPREWAVHPGVMCDGCDGGIIGPRFKCVACPDFDWCVNCEADPSLVHDVGEGHYFLKIDKPIKKRDNFSSVLAQAHDLIHSLHKEVEPKVCKEEDETLVDLTSTESKEEAETSDKKLSDVQKMLETLSCEAQKLPGADLIPAGSPIKTSLNKFTSDHTTVKEEEDDYEKEDYDMRLVKDITIPDGTLVMAGSHFNKSWLVQNTGKLAWPTSTLLQVTSSSNAVNAGKTMTLLEKPLAPQESIEIGAKDLQAGEALGQQHVYFRLAIPNVSKAIQGKRFGQQLWCQVQVVDGSGSGSGSGSNTGSAFLSASGHKSNEGQHWDQQESSLSSSFFQPPKAPDSEGPPSEAYTLSQTNNLKAEEVGGDDLENVSFASSHGGFEEGDDDEYEIVDPTTEGEDSDSYI